MRLCLIICAMALASCGPGKTAVVRTYVPADLLETEAGWEGPAPQSEREFIRAAEAEKAGRERANAKLEAIGDIVK